MNSDRTAVIAGASGLVGGFLLDILLDDTHYQKIVAIGRRDLSLQHPKLVQVRTPLENLSELASDLKVQDVFCCLGTTLAKAGSRAAFRQVDYEFPVALASMAVQNGADQFLMVSAQGADPKSFFFYNRVKGQAEQAISELDLSAIHILRPSLLLGERKESRRGEFIAQKISTIIPWVGPMRHLKPIQAQQVALAMCKIAMQDRKGLCTYSSSQLTEISSSDLPPL